MEPKNTRGEKWKINTSKAGRKGGIEEQRINGKNRKK